MRLTPYGFADSVIKFRYPPVLPIFPRSLSSLAFNLAERKAVHPILRTKAIDNG